MEIKRYYAETIDPKHGEYVSYADHAAEVSALRERVFEMQNAAIDLVMQNTSLLAQLEAAKLKLGYYAEGVDLQGIASKVNKDAVERDALRYGPGTAGHAQLTDQPSVLRDIAALPVDSDSSAKAVSLAKVALGLPMPTYKSVAEMEQALTAQPDGVRPRPWTADGYIVRDANGDGFAECPTKADALLLTTPAAKETKP